MASLPVRSIPKCHLTRHEPQGLISLFAKSVLFRLTLDLNHNVNPGDLLPGLDGGPGYFHITVSVNVLYAGLQHLLTKVNPSVIVFCTDGAFQLVQGEITLILFEPGKAVVKRSEVFV